MTNIFRALAGAAMMIAFALVLGAVGVREDVSNGLTSVFLVFVVLWITRNAQSCAPKGAK